MKNRTYIISKKAVSDIEEIWLFTLEKWSIEQADRYYNLLFDGNRLHLQEFECRQIYGSYKERLQGVKGKIPSYFL